MKVGISYSDGERGKIEGCNRERVRRRKGVG